MLRRRLFLEWCAIVALTAALVTAMVLTRATARIDNAAYDVLVGLRAPPPSDRILIVAIDDPSLAALGSWPWPRSLHARTIDRIATARPAAIAYDVLFTEPGVPTDDAALAAAVRRAPVVLPVLVETPGLDGRAFDVTPPIPSLHAAATAVGHVVLPHDEDGTARGALLALSGPAGRWPHLAEAAYERAFRHPSPASQRADQVIVPYQPASGGFRTVSFQSVLAGNVPAQFFRDRIVLVGATAGGLGDLHSVPTRGGSALPGVEIQANLLNALIADQLVIEVPLGVRLAAALLPVLVLMFGFWRMRPSRALVAAVAMIAAMLVVPALMLVFLGLWLPPAPALIGLLLVYPLWGWRRLQTVDSAIARELALFAGDVPAARAFPDSADGHAAQLSSSIALLRDLRRLIGDTIEGVGDPLVVTAMDGTLLLANRAAHALLGDDIVGTPAEGLLGRLLGEPISFDALPAEVTPANGRTYSLRRTRLSAADGAQRGWILLLAEITAIRDAERDREQALEFLSHDMRAPQASILNLLGDTAPLTPELASRIATHARRTLMLADDFVQLARLGNTPFDAEETDLCDALAEAQDAVWPQAAPRGVRIVATGTDAPCCVLGEGHALRRALVNLLDNAVKFSPDGGEIRCAIGQSQGRIALSIEDHGPGVVPERLSDLFGRFGAIAPRGSAPTSGLGLAYVHAVAERHGATIDHHAVAPHGARFVLQFRALDPSGGPERDTD